MNDKIKRNGKEKWKERGMGEKSKDVDVEEMEEEKVGKE